MPPLPASLSFYGLWNKASGRSCWGVLKYHFLCSWMLWDAFQLCLSIISLVFGCFGHIFHFPLCLCLVPGQRHSFWGGPAFPMKPWLNGLKLFSSPASTSCLPRVSVLSSHTHLGPRFWFSHPSPYPLPVTHRPPSDLHLPGPFRVTRQLPLFYFHCRENWVSEEMYSVSSL